MFRDELIQSATSLLEHARQRSYHLCTAESCTGGLIASLLTEIPGSSDVVDCGFVTYSNEAKSRLIGVDPIIIEQNGAVSEPVARAMAEGARRVANVDIAIAVTGVAGPGGGSIEKPIGLVHLAAATRIETRHKVLRLGHLSRNQIRMASVAEALTLLNSLIVE